MSGKMRVMAIAATGRIAGMVGLSPIFSRVGLECPILSIGVKGRNPGGTESAQGGMPFVEVPTSSCFNLDS